MIFSSQVFIFYFLPVVLGVYFLLPCRKNMKARNLWLAAASIFFYAWWDWRMLPFLAAAVFVCHRAGRYIYDGGKYRKSMLAMAVVITCGTLAVCKYLPAAAEFFAPLAGTSVPLWVEKIFLPLGISFYTFQALSYTFDAFAGKSEPVGKASFTDFFTGTAMFPQLAAGPIVRWSQLAPQLAWRKHTWNCAGEGALLFMLGLGKKVLIADTLGTIADPVFEQNCPAAAAAWLGIIAYTLQIYFDFSAYCDMGTGIGRIMGFRLPRNFRSPYRQFSVSGFWKHWHITLTAWLRDYIYIPLGGSRKGMFRTLINIYAVMIICGIWHGAGWNFILFGLLHGTAMAAERLTAGRIRFPAWAGWIWMMFIVICGFVLFRTTDPAGAVNFFLALAGKGNTGCGYLLNSICTPAAFVILAAGAVTAVCRITSRAMAVRCTLTDCLWATAIFAASLLKMAGGVPREFIYFIF